MKRHIVWVTYTKYKGLGPILREVTQDKAQWDRVKSPEDQLADLLQHGEFVQLSPIIEVEVDFRREEELVPEMLKGLDELESKARADFESETLHPIQKRRQELRMLTHTQGVEVVEKERKGPPPECLDGDFDDIPA